MKVLYFHQYFSTPDGAAGTRSYEMAKQLVARGHHVLMICGSAERGATGLHQSFVNGRRRGVIAEGIEVLEYDLSYSNSQGLLRRSALFLRFALRSARVALTEPYDLVFATSTPLTAGIPGVLAKWLRRKPFVFEVRDLWPELPRAMGVIRNRIVLASLSALEWITYHSARSLVALSPGIRDGIARRGIAAARITMIPNGCDMDLFAGAREPWRPDGVKPTDFVAVFAGAHGLANGLDAALNAAAELKRAGRNDIRVVLIGAGRLKPSLQERARRERLDNVAFCAPVGKERLAGLLAGADIGLQLLANVPAFYDGTSPNKFFDYLSAGLPVLINYPGWLANVVAEHECGYAVSPDDPGAFAAALIHAADHRAELRQMGQRARCLGAQRFNRVALATEFVDCLERAAR